MLVLNLVMSPGTIQPSTILRRLSLSALIPGTIGLRARYGSAP